MNAKRAFCDYLEAPIKFMPSYKYDIGSSQFDSRYDNIILKFLLNAMCNSEKQRAPSWCDRVLWFKNPLKTDSSPSITNIW